MCRVCVCISSSTLFEIHLDKLYSFKSDHTAARKFKKQFRVHVASHSVDPQLHSDTDQLHVVVTTGNM